jgi:ATP-dependent DNA helicase RecG
MREKSKQLDYILSFPKENEVVEWKEAKNSYDFKKFGKYFSALSNEANLKGVNSAWLVFGVSNNKNIIGTEYREKRGNLNSLKCEIAKQTTDGITLKEIHSIRKNRKRVLLFEIPAAPKGVPIAFQGHYYARNNDELTSLNLEKVDRIRMQSNREDWSAKICGDATIGDLDIKAIKRAKEGFIKKYPNIDKKEILKWDNEKFLNKAKITIKGKITNTAILLLGKPESEHFINPSSAKISWILKDNNGIEKDYEHFSCPLILSVDKVHDKIRNLRYRYISNKSLFPDEIDRYDPSTIREAINNCIAHQDYYLCGKINVVENEDDCLIFSNLGSFIPGTVEKVIETDSPSEYYRNKFLADAMVSVNMIDTIGSGIKKMFISQRRKFFPLPEYDLDNNKVKLTIIGKVLDIEYAKKLAQIPDLDLKIIIALDKVQKRKKLTQQENKKLRAQGYIEGRSPNIFISSKIAIKIDEKEDYMKRKGIEDEYIQKMILDYLKKFKEASRNDLEKMLLDKISVLLGHQQKKDKVKNLLQKLKNEGKIKLNEDKKWTLSK